MAWVTTCMRGILHFGLLCAITFCLVTNPVPVRAETGAGALPTRTEFEARASALAGLPGKAHELLKLSNDALAGGAGNDPAYAVLAHGYKSHALWLRNDYAKAEAEARQAIRADPGTALSYFFLADALNAQLRYDDAYLACLHGATRRGDAARQAETRTRCRSDYAQRVTMEPAAVLKAAKNGRLPVAGNSYILVSGRIAAVTTGQGKDDVVFVCDTGRLTCRLAPAASGTRLTPMTTAEDGKYSSPTAGLRKDQFVTIRGIVRSIADDKVFMDTCELFAY